MQFYIFLLYLIYSLFSYLTTLDVNCLILIFQQFADLPIVEQFFNLDIIDGIGGSGMKASIIDDENITNTVTNTMTGNNPIGDNIERTEGQAANSGESEPTVSNVDSGSTIPSASSGEGTSSNDESANINSGEGTSSKDKGININSKEDISSNNEITHSDWDEDTNSDDEYSDPEEDPSPNFKYTNPLYPEKKDWSSKAEWMNQYDINYRAQRDAEEVVRETARQEYMENLIRNRELRAQENSFQDVQDRPQPRIRTEPQSEPVEDRQDSPKSASYVDEKDCCCGGMDGCRCGVGNYSDVRNPSSVILSFSWFVIKLASWWLDRNVAKSSTVTKDYKKEESSTTDLIKSVNVKSGKHIESSVIDTEVINSPILQKEENFPSFMIDSLEKELPESKSCREDENNRGTNGSSRSIVSDLPLAWGLYFQDGASPSFEGIAELHNRIMFYLILILFGVTWVMSSIMVNFNKKENPLVYRHLNHGTLIELIWTVGPALVLVAIAFPSFKLLYLMDEVIDPAMSVKVTGHQWYWQYEYADFLNEENENIDFDSYMKDEGSLEEGELRLLEVDNPLVLPADTHIRFIITGADVIHDWALPVLGLKVDACPGRLNQVSVIIERTGVYYGQCSEICGVLHSSMPIKLEAVDVEKFFSWILEQ